jgi:hypothetical protein
MKPRLMQTVCSILTVSLNKESREMEETWNRWKSKCVKFSPQQQVSDLCTEITAPLWRLQLYGTAFSELTVCFAQNSNWVLYRHSGEGGEVSRGQFTTISTTGGCRLNCGAGRWGFGGRMSDTANNRDVKWDDVTRREWGVKHNSNNAVNKENKKIEKWKETWEGDRNRDTQFALGLR